MKLYHISKDFKNNIDKFIPRIPRDRAKGENNTINRICVSPTINGCLNGEPSISYNMFDYPTMEFFCPHQAMEQLSTLLDHEEKTGYLYKVYEFDVDDSKIIKPEFLFENKLVPDALFSKEHWIIKEEVPNKFFYILVKDGIRKKNESTKFNYDVYELQNLGKITYGSYHYRKERDSDFVLEYEILQ